MNFGLIKYLAIYIAPLVVIISLSWGGMWAYFALFFVFAFIPILELLLPASSKNMSKAQEEVAKKEILYDVILYGLVPLQYCLMAYFLWRIATPNIPLFEQIGMVTAFGLSCGILGINAAHELGHRNTWYEQTMSQLLLLTTLYMHFFIEHNRGHHKNVSTDEDPASGRYGETLYAFYVRSVRDSWLSAWNLERERLNREGQAFFSWHNQMLRFQVYQIGLIALVGSIFGGRVLLCYLLAAAMGILLLETVNYIEHYGLRRKKNNDIYERVQPIHSWNSDHPLGRLFLLDVTRHSDHHYVATRKYQILRHFDDSPQMPTGYPGMMLLAFIPPLWFRVMHARIERYRKTQDGEALA